MHTSVLVGTEAWVASFSTQEHPADSDGMARFAWQQHEQVGCQRDPHAISLPSSLWLVLEKALRAGSGDWKENNVILWPKGGGRMKLIIAHTRDSYSTAAGPGSLSETTLGLPVGMSSQHGGRGNRLIQPRSPIRCLSSVILFAQGETRVSKVWVGVSWLPGWDRSSCANPSAFTRAVPLSPITRSPRGLIKWSIRHTGVKNEGYEIDLQSLHRHLLISDWAPGTRVEKSGLYPWRIKTNKMNVIAVFTKLTDSLDLSHNSNLLAPWLWRSHLSTPGLSFLTSAVGIIPVPLS